MVSAVSTTGLSKRFGSIVALDDLDLEVHGGEVFGLLGPNGAGKTTLLRVILGLLVPDHGSATIFGLDAQRDVVAAHRRLAYVAGEVNLWPSMTGAETLHLLARVHGDVDLAYRDELVGRFEFDPSRKVRTLSRGNRQKLMLIAALMTRSDLLVFDEPTSGLDPLMEQVFRECVRAARHRVQTVLLSSHVLSEVEALCDRIGILRRGQLIQVGTLEEMRNLSSLTIEATFNDAAPDVASVPGVSRAVVEGGRLTCQVRGPVAPLLEVLARAGVTKVLSREPSLEEIFLTYYGEDGSTPS